MKIKKLRCIVESRVESLNAKQKSRSLKFVKFVARSQSAVQWSKMTSQLSSTYDVTAHIDSREINILDLLLIQLQHV